MCTLESAVYLEYKYIFHTVGMAHLIGMLQYQGHPEFLLIEPAMKKCRAIPLSHVNTLPLIVHVLRGWLASHMQQGDSAGSKKKFIRKSS